MAVDAAQPSDTYDVTVLLEQCMGDLEMAVELLDRFESRLGTTCRSLELHICEGDLPAAAAVAHSLKGEAGMLAANRLHALAARLEHSLRLPEPLDLPGLLSGLRCELQQCLAASPAVRQAIVQMQTFQS